MASIRAIYTQTEAAALEKQLSQNAAPESALHAMRGCIERVRQNYIAAEDDDFLRHQSVPLFAVASGAVGTMLAAKDTAVTVQAPRRVKHADAVPVAPVPSRWQRLLKRLDDGLLATLCMDVSAVLLIMMAVDGHLGGIILSVIALLISGLQVMLLSRRREPVITEYPPSYEPPTADARVLVNAGEAVRVLDQMFLEMDRALSRAARPLEDKSVQLNWSEDQLAAVQVLWEAMEDQDGTYALKAVPNLLNALTRQGVRLVAYTPDNADSFIELPGVGELRTVRPALYIGEELLVKGRITR